MGEDSQTKGYLAPFMKAAAPSFSLLKTTTAEASLQGAAWSLDEATAPAPAKPAADPTAALGSAAPAAKDGGLAPANDTCPKVATEKAEKAEKPAKKNADKAAAAAAKKAKEEQESADKAKRE